MRLGDDDEPTGPEPTPETDPPVLDEAPTTGGDQ